MSENYFLYDKACSFLRHSALMPNRPTLLFLHGIGDSSLSYIPFLKSSALNQFNILIPDFLGYGKSAHNGAYDFSTQVNAVMNHIFSLEKTIGFSFDNIIVIPHSMAAIHAMMLCNSPLQKNIKGIISVEGSITQYGSFISKSVSDISNQGKFDQWFNIYVEVLIFKNFLDKFPICRPYYASLRFCDPHAFLQNALEIRQVCLAGIGQYTNIAGQQFAELNLPKVYCYGDKSLCHESIHFLTTHKIPTKIFQTENHFVMLDCFHEFVQFIIDWINLQKLI